MRLRKRAKKHLSRFPQKDQIYIVAGLKEFVASPYSGDIEKILGEENVWRRRIGAYRIFYEIISQEKVIHVFRIERRASKTY
ncbi:MAG: type II toxin-antitoxin system RelE/ParE family toxin [Parcubacteria group bacterium]|nr:type II toxin-antitoxin system RelE/ParE family toxin [Parcubacteria group bacterium]